MSHKKHTLRSRITRESSQKIPEVGTTSIADGMTVTINFDEIDEYSLNPRIYPNPRFSEIKESIRERGILQALRGDPKAWMRPVHALLRRKYEAALPEGIASRNR